MKKAPDEILIALTDIHGSYDKVEALLERLDEKFKIFQKSDTLREGVTLHFNGDYIDRGPKGPQVLDLVRRLDEANESVTVLSGNHEFMAVFGASELAEYKKANPSLTQEQYIKWYNTSTVHGTNFGRFFVQQCGGIDAFIDTYEKNKCMGTYLLTRPLYMMHQIGNTKVLFTHADLPDELDDLDVLQFAQEEYLTFLPTYLQNGFKNDSEFKEWRLMATLLCEERVEYPHTQIRRKDAVLKAIGVDYHSVGHTPQNAVFQYGKTIYFDVGIPQNQYAGALIFTKDRQYFYTKKEERVIKVR
jgi:hypothetical protein